jgi:two-component system, sensor histidine kinase and response regulator
VLTNLIGNAIKFTDEGKIEVRIIPDEIKFTPGLAIEVEDTGVGIPLEDQEWVFDRFRHGKDRRAGSGLGLYLCRCIVEAHDGRIELRSKPGEGCLFRVRLPL